MLAEEYLRATGDREPLLRELHNEIRQAAPTFAPVVMEGMKNPMIGYGMQPYKNTSGKVQEWPIVALGDQKNYVSIYICALEDGEYVAEKYKTELGSVSVGKSCVRIKNLDQLNLATFRRILGGLESRVASGEKVYGY